MGAASRSADENSNGISHRWMDTLPLLTPATVRKLARTSLRLSAQYRAIAQVVEDYNTHLCGQEDPGDIPRILPAGWVRQARAECSIEPRFWSTSVFPWTSHFSSSVLESLMGGRHGVNPPLLHERAWEPIRINTVAH
jgi:hypothetical protein